MYTVQCVLPINLFNQQIFTMIWLWYMFVLFWNIINLFAWINREIDAENWTLRRVVLIDKKISEHKERIKHFLKKYLDSDGMLKKSLHHKLSNSGPSQILNIHLEILNFRSPFYRNNINL